MNPRVREYLIIAHKKVIAHHHQILEASSLTEAEREHIQRSLARIESELENIVADGASDSVQYVRMNQPSGKEPAGIALPNEFAV